MTVGTATTNAEHDPVAAALADSVVVGRLLAAAKSYLGRRGFSLGSIQRNAEAEAIVSEVRTRALAKRKQFDPTRDVVKWLVKFVINVAREFLKKAGRELTGSEQTELALENLADDVGLPLDSLVINEQCERVAELVAGLATEDRELLRLTYDEGLTFKEIAEQIGAKPDTVRVRHFRLIVRLRELFGAGEGQP